MYKFKFFRLVLRLGNKARRIKPVNVVTFIKASQNG